MFEDIPRNVWRHSPIPQVPYILFPVQCIPGFFTQLLINSTFQSVWGTHFLIFSACFLSGVRQGSSQHKNIKENEKQLNEDFENICEWFAYNKLSMLDEIMFPFSVTDRIDNKLKSLLLGKMFLSPNLRRQYCNALIQPHFDYTCSAE